MACFCSLKDRAAGLPTVKDGKSSVEKETLTNTWREIFQKLCTYF